MGYFDLKATRMNKYISFFLLILVNIVTAEAVGNYTWEDYDGEVPSNAFLAGYGENDTKIYIGQGPGLNKIIQGKIYANDSKVYFEFGGEGLSPDEDIKILCTDNAENFQWIPVTDRDVLKLRETTTVIDVGYERGFLTFIGRININNNTEVGKVICQETDCMALYINGDGESEEHYNFDILTFNPDNENNLDYLA